MADWCTNTLTVTGPSADVDRFAAANTRHGILLSFEALVPPPSGLSVDALHTFRERNWGTKWDNEAGTDVTVTRQNLEEGIACVTYTFQTAYTPPRAWLRVVAPRFRTLSCVMDFSEPGNRLRGTMTRTARTASTRTPATPTAPTTPTTPATPAASVQQACPITQETPAPSYDPPVQALIAVAMRALRFFREAPITELELVETVLGINAPIAALEAALTAVGVMEVAPVAEPPLGAVTAKRARARYSALLAELVDENTLNTADSEDTSCTPG